MTKYRIVVLQTIPIPYRYALFESIAAHPSLELYLYLTASSRKDRERFTRYNWNFEYRFLPRFALSSYINPLIISELLRNRYDAIIAGGYFPLTNQIAFVLAKITKTPFILWSAGTSYESNPLRKIGLPIIKLIVKHSDALISVGSRSKQYLLSLGAFKENIFMAPNVIDNEFFKKESCRLKQEKGRWKKDIGIKKEKIVLYVGRLIEGKGIRYLIRAYADLRRERDHVALVIIGDGPQRDELVHFCEVQGIKDVHFLGYIENEQLPLYYSMANVFVLPSSLDTFGMVILEAMACSLPIVVTNQAGASNDLVKNGVNGYIVQDRNSNQLCEAIKKILADSEVERSMGEQSRKMIEEGFTLEYAVSGFFDAINYVADSGT